MKHFSTAGIRQAEVVPSWFDYICKTYVPVTLENHDTRQFCASLKSINIGKTNLTQVRSSAAQYARTRQNIRQSDHGEYLLTLMTSGEMLFEQNDRVARIGSGDLCLFDTAQPYRLKCVGAYEALHLKIPRLEFDRRLPHAEKVSAMRVAADGRYAQLAATMIQSTVNLIEEDASRQLAPTLLDLVSLAFDESFNALSQDNSRYAKIVARAQEAIMDHLFDPAFDLTSVPAQIGVSSRTLSRAFAQMGLTPSKWMWSQRLEAARDMIVANKGRSVSEVAMACGFNDFSHFSRAFKAQFGVTPSSLLGTH